MAKDNGGMAGKNELVPVNGGLRDPYQVMGSDFPDGKTSADAGHGQGSDGPGKNELVACAENQCGPRFVEDDGCGASGAGTPVPGNRGARVSANFSVGTSAGEGGSAPSGSSIPQMIDLSSGYIGGGEQTRVKEVPQFNVSIASGK